MLLLLVKETNHCLNAIFDKIIVLEKNGSLLKSLKHQLRKTKTKDFLIQIEVQCKLIAGN
jgi:hypothetical protein